jgi:protein-tyrosine phosphatase
VRAAVRSGCALRQLTGPRVYTAEVVILFVCTANVCRSPMAAALLDVAVGDIGESVTVASAGLLEGGRPVTPEVIKVMTPFGADMTAHRSTRLTETSIEAADLILTMERRHGREVALLVPTAWSRTFTLKDLIRRGEEVGPRAPGQPVASWLEVVGQGRERSALTGRAAEDEVADPIGGRIGQYRSAAAELSDLVNRLVRLLWSDAGRADS